MARKSNAQKAAEAAAALEAAQAAEETTVETGTEASVDANGEDLGDVTGNGDTTPESTPEEVAEPSDDAIDPTDGVIDEDAPSEAPEPVQEPEQGSVVTAELAEILTSPELADEITKQINDEIVAQLVKTATEYELEDGFTPILRPTMVGDSYTGYIACPKAVFDVVQTEGWQALIDTHPAKHALKSVLYWKNINGFATVRCMSSSKFADVK